MLLRLIAFCLSAVLVLGAARADQPDPRNWDDVLAAARGETVYFHAWGGEPRINDYVAWAGREVERRFGVRLVHVKVAETGAVVAKILTEKAAGREAGGSVDLVWINGENFAAMKENGLLPSRPWSDALPNHRFVDVEGKPTVTSDFGIPVDGLEAPWGMAKLVFFHDEAVLADPPRSTAALGEWIAANPGRFTYPQPPDFMGTTFLKQVLADLAADPEQLQRPVSAADPDAVTKPLWDYLDRVTPHLWRQGRAYPRDYGSMRRLFGDGEVALSFAFNPADASNAIANGELPDTVRSFVFEDGTIGNTHFLAIPFNASAEAGAMVVADFLLSPEAQARKEDAAVWGDPTVLAVENLPEPERARFAGIERGPATLAPEALGPVLPEPHPSWVAWLEAEWARRYGAGQ